MVLLLSAQISEKGGQLTKYQTLKMYNFCSLFQIHLEFSQDFTEYKIF